MGPLLLAFTRLTSSPAHAQLLRHHCPLSANALVLQPRHPPSCPAPSPPLPQVEADKLREEQEAHARSRTEATARGVAGERAADKLKAEIRARDVSDGGPWRGRPGGRSGQRAGVWVRGLGVRWRHVDRRAGMWVRLRAGCRESRAA